jgi:hypothetical protein
MKGGLSINLSLMLLEDKYAMHWVEVGIEFKKKRGEKAADGRCLIG